MLPSSQQNLSLFYLLLFFFFFFLLLLLHLILSLLPQLVSVIRPSSSGML
jgi:hypothetical protein